MVNESRSDLNDYLYGLFYGTVTENVYPKGVPTELKESDVKNGFIVIKAGSINDKGEFRKQTYASVRCYVEVYVPVISRGRFNKKRYKELEDAVNEVIDNEIAQPSSTTYTINEDDIFTYDDEEEGRGDNRFHIFIKTFVVNVDEQE